MSKSVWRIGGGGGGACNAYLYIFLLLLAMLLLLLSFNKVDYVPTLSQYVQGTFTPPLSLLQTLSNSTSTTTTTVTTNITITTTTTTVPCNCSTAHVNTTEAKVPCTPSTPSPPVEMQWSASKPWHGPDTFPLCSMDSCFNYTRCEAASDLLIYHYSEPYGPERFFTSLLASPWYTPDPNRACLFMVSTRSRKPISGLPYWNGGLNHLVVTFADKYTIQNPPPPALGNASLISSELHETTARPGFDISIPLPARHPADPRILQLLPHRRKYFLTFKGTRYLGGGEGSFRSDPSFKSMHNGVDVIVVVSCRQPTNDHLRKIQPALGVGCDEDQILYNNYTFPDLMNSTFVLAPAGRSPASYRFIESLSAGAIPVLICDNYVKPFDSLIQWHQCLLQFPTSEMHRILPALRALSPEEVEKRQKYCIFVYREYLKDDASLLRATVLSLKLRFYGALPNLTQILPTSP